MKKSKVQEIYYLISQYFTIFDKNYTVHYKYEFTIYSLNNELYLSLYNFLALYLSVVS